MGTEIILSEKFDLEKTAESGQCFRWRRCDGADTAYQITAFGKSVVISVNNDQKILHLNCSEEDAEKIWRPYFDLDTDYTAIRNTVASSDSSGAYLRAAMDYGDGIRIIRQDFWECLVTFIISQRKNIPAITQCVDKLCRAAGAPIIDTQSVSATLAEPTLYAFPTPEQILALSCHKNGDTDCSFAKAGLGSCSLGYRVPYIFAAAEWMLRHPDFVKESETMTDDEVRDALMEIKGVGIKVASCVMLFGLQRMNAFPVDVWVNRAIKKAFRDESEIMNYSPNAGLIQQYIFFYEKNHPNR